MFDQLLLEAMLEGAGFLLRCVGVLVAIWLALLVAGLLRQVMASRRYGSRRNEYRRAWRREKW